MGYTNVIIVVKNGRVDRVFSPDPVNVEVVDLDTQDEEELKELEEYVKEVEDTNQTIYE